MIHYRKRAPKRWRFESRTVRFRNEYGLQIEQHAVRLPSGRQVTDYYQIALADAALVVAFTANDCMLISERYFYGVRGTTLCLPGGHVEHGESPSRAAARELREETGYRCAKMTRLGALTRFGNQGGGRDIVFVGTGAEKHSQPKSDELESMDLYLMTRNEVRKALLAGAFRIGTHAAAIGWVLQLPAPSQEKSGMGRSQRSK